MDRDEDVQQRVERELVFDPLVDDADITVIALLGDVALEGTVPSYPQFLEAIAAARRVAGVGRVDNRLDVVLPEEDYRDDPMLTTAANNALAANVTVPPGIEASAEDGVLTLTGVVGVGTQRDDAAAAVSGLIGVRSIDNRILIENLADPVDVLLNVREALDRYSIVDDDSDVRINTDEHRVTLNGTVSTWAERDAVVDAAWRTRGVYDVRDELSITN